MTRSERDRSEYYQTYYEGRREELSEKRRDRYATDTEYREKAKNAAKKYREKKKEDRNALRAAGKLPPAHARGPRKPVAVRVNGSVVMARTITVAANQVGRSVDTLNKWSKIGLLPETPLRSRRGDRLYTDGMILVMKTVILKRGQVSSSDPTFYSEVEAGWAKLGIEI